MDKLTIIEQIRKNSNLLSLPQVLSEILKEVDKEDFSADALVNIILKDPSLTGRILRMANSSFYQRYSEIKTVNQAISLMGMTTVKCLALSSSVFHLGKTFKDVKVSHKDLFGYILSVAAASKKIAMAVSYPSHEEAFISGLLLDIGLLFFFHHYPKEYNRIINKKVKADSLCEAEKKVFGVDHTEIGFEMANIWKIPKEIKNTIYKHHDLSRDDDTLHNIVKLAVLLTKDHFSGFEMSIEERLNNINEIAKKLSITKQKVDEISSSLLMETFEIASFLGIDIGNIDDMLIKANQEIWETYLVVENLFKERQELTKNLLEEEHARGAVESKNIAMATLSHYLNNAVMGIYGRTQIMRMMMNKNNTDKVIEQLPETLNKIDNSVKKIVAVLNEIKEVSPLDHKKFDSMSKAMNIDDLIEKRMKQINFGSHSSPSLAAK